MTQKDQKDADATKPAVDRNAPIVGKPPQPNTTQEAVIEKAQAMRDGADPELVERLEELEDTKKLVKVTRDGDTLRVHPSTVQAHVDAGWKLV